MCFSEANVQLVQIGPAALQLSPWCIGTLRDRGAPAAPCTPESKAEGLGI